MRLVFLILFVSLFLSGCLINQESKKVFEFKVKIAGELPENFKKKIKMALAKYEATKISAVKKTVVQEHPLDFPKLQNKEVNIFEISLIPLGVDTPWYELGRWPPDAPGFFDYCKIKKIRC